MSHPEPRATTLFIRCHCLECSQSLVPLQRVPTIDKAHKNASLTNVNKRITMEKEYKQRGTIVRKLRTNTDFVPFSHSSQADCFRSLSVQ